MNIHRNPGISQSVFVISVLVRQHTQVHPKFSPVLRRAPKLITITPIVLLYRSSEIPVTSVPVVWGPSYSEGLPEYPPRVWYSPEIDASKFTLHILSDTPGVFQKLKYILLMFYRSWEQCALCLTFSWMRMVEIAMYSSGYHIHADEALKHYAPDKQQAIAVRDHVRQYIRS